MPQAWKITRITEEVGMEEGRLPTTYIRVDFLVGEDGPFVHRMPKKEFKPELLRRHLDEFARDVAQLRG